MAPAVAVVIPAFNEEARIGGTVTAVRRLPLVRTVLVVDDGSQDNTALVARAAGARVVRHQHNCGKGQALRTGVKRIREDIVLLLDADLEESAGYAGALLAPVVAGAADMTIARFPRRRPAGFGLVRGLATWGIYWLAGVCVESSLSGQRAMRRAVLERVRLVDGWGIEVALTIDAVRQGFRVCEVPVPMRHRESGRTWRGFLHRGRQFAGVAAALWACRRVAQP
jgi:glycosyltransferase involved in cell wall biosynthesis